MHHFIFLEILVEDEVIIDGLHRVQQCKKVIIIIITTIIIISIKTTITVLKHDKRG